MSVVESWNDSWLRRSRSWLHEALGLRAERTSMSCGPLALKQEPGRIWLAIRRKSEISRGHESHAKSAHWDSESKYLRGGDRTGTPV